MGREVSMASIKRIGIITSGGDCGGLNAVIKVFRERRLRSVSRP
jgi:6-phosphofructokinase